MTAGETKIAIERLCEFFLKLPFVVRDGIISTAGVKGEIHPLVESKEDLQRRIYDLSPYSRASLWNTVMRHYPENEESNPFRMTPSDVHEYAFDVKLSAVIRVKAKTKEEALGIIELLQAETLPPEHIALPWEMTEWSVIGFGPPSDAPKLFEIDGKEVKE